MAQLGTEKKPIIVRVQTEARGRYVAEKCTEHGWHYIIGLEPGKPEDLSDLEKALNPPHRFVPRSSAVMIPALAAAGRNTRSAVVRVVYSKPDPSWRCLDKAQRNPGNHATIIPGSASSTRATLLELIRGRVTAVMR